MHGTFERPGKIDKAGELSSGIRLVIIPTILGIAVVALAITQPNVARWISDAAQAEFVGPAPGPAPAQLAQPAQEMHTVKAN